MNNVNKVLILLFALVSATPVYSMGKKTGKAPQDNGSGSDKNSRQSSSSSTSGLQSNSNALTRKEQEAIDAEIALKMMEEECEAMGIDPADVRSGRFNVSYDQPRRQSDSQAISSMSAESSAFAPRSSVASPSNPTRKRVQSLLSDMRRITTQAGDETLTDKMEPILLNWENSYNNRGYFRSLLICGGTSPFRTMVSMALAQAAKQSDPSNFEIIYFNAAFLDFYHPDEACKVLEELFTDKQNPNKKGIVIIDGVDIYESERLSAGRRALRDIVLRRSDGQEENFIVVLLCEGTGCFKRMFANRVRGRNSSVLDLGDASINVEGVCERPLYSTEPRVQALNITTRSTSSSCRSNSAAETSAASPECSICLENKKFIFTPCCLSKVCQDCWEGSLQATANAGHGGHARQCPVCKTEESAWLTDNNE